MTDIEALLSDTDDLLGSFEDPGELSLPADDADLFPVEAEAIDIEELELPDEPARQPIFNPSHNMREVAKELLLLEDHLFQPSRHCPDCIRKHLLKAEALADEAVTLDKKGTVGPEASRLAGTLRKVHRAVIAGADRPRLAQTVRKVRKDLAKRYAGAVTETDEGTQIGSAARQVSTESGTPQRQSIWKYIPSPKTRPQEKALGWLRVGDITLGDYLALFDFKTQAKARQVFRGVSVQWSAEIRALRVRSKGRRAELASWQKLLLDMDGMADQTPQLGGDATTAGVWTPIKAQNYAKGVYAKAAEVGLQRSYWETLLGQIAKGELYAVEPGEDPAFQIRMTLRDVTDRLFKAAEVSEDYAPLHQSVAKQVYKIELDLDRGLVAASDAPAVGQVIEHGTRVLARFDGVWSMGVVIDRGGECGGFEVGDLPDEGTYPVSYADGTCSWVRTEHLLAQINPPISGILKTAKPVVVRNLVGTREVFKWTPERLVMADLIETVLRHELGDVCSRLRVPGCEKLSAKRRSGLLDKLVLAAIVNAIYESRLKPGEVGDGGHSVGLFQLHDGGGGHGMTVAQRKDPVQNTKRIAGELMTQLNRSGSGFIALEEREINALSMAATPPAWEWAQVFTVDVERPAQAAAKGRNRAWTLAGMLGAPESELEKIVSTAPTSPPMVAVMAPKPLTQAPAQVPSTPTRERTWDTWRKPVLTTATVGFSLAAIGLALKAVAVQAEGAQGIAEGRFRPRG